MAVTPPLMSERNEPYASSWRDCAYASALMVCWKRGKHTYPLGYGWQEREALERSDNRANETGASVLDIDVATQNRYGFKLSPVANLAASLKGSNLYGYMVMGENSHLTSWLKRWSPSFNGGHCVYVQPTGDGAHVRWLDPMAPWGYTGDIVPVSTVLYWNSASNGGPNNSRMAKEPTVVVPTTTPGVTLKYGGYEGFRGTWRVIASGSRFRSKPYLSAPIVATVNAGYQWHNEQTTDKGSVVNGTGRWLGEASGDKWMHVSLCTLVK